jgi:cytochrome c oxidase cbb3-type subunit 3
MSNFWSIWITVLTLGSLLGCYLILRYCLKNFTGVEEGQPTGHVFDGIEELNNPLPQWWSTFFFVTIIWGLAYLIMYPGLGNWPGLFGWKSSNQGIMNIEESIEKANFAKENNLIIQYDQEVKAADAKFGPIFDKYAAIPIKQIAATKSVEIDFDTRSELTAEQQLLVDGQQALKIGQRLYMQNCSQCHGSNAGGTTSFPNLTDDDWLYGGTPEDIVHTLIKGRQAKGMIAWKTALGGEQGVKDVAAYVLSLSNRQAVEGDVAVGKQKFAMCASCHGTEGQGSLAMSMPLGAPNLTDDIWLYGGSERKVQETIRYGRAGVMPAWNDILGEQKIHVISAYIYSLSQP